MDNLQINRLMKLTLKKIFSSNVTILILFFILWFYLFRFTGSLIKGYNIYEDYNIIKFQNELKYNSFFSLAVDVTKVSIKTRARFCPVSDFHKLLSIKIFGTNFPLFTFHFLLIGIFTSYLLYLFCRGTGFSVVQSFLFGVLVFTGPYVIIWSDISVGECIGMLFFSLSLFLGMCSINSKKYKLVYDISFVVSLLITGLCKENFIIAIPSAAFLYVWMFSFKNKVTILNSLKSNFKIILSLFTVTILLLLCIFLLVGINNQNYAGLDTKKLGPEVILNFITNLFNYKIFIVILIGLFLILISYLLNRKNKQTKSGDVKIHKYYFLNLFLLFSLITVPQYILYLKTGLIGRYLMPFMMGFSFVLIFILKFLFDSKSSPRIIKYSYLLLIFIFLFFEVKNNTIVTLMDFAKECTATTRMADLIVKDPRDKLLLVMDPAMNYHEVYSLQIYLDYLNSNKNYKYDFVKTDYRSKYFSDTGNYNLFADAARDKFRTSMIDSSKSNEDINTILVFVTLDKKFVKKNIGWFKEDNFTKENIGKYTLYRKK